MIEVKGKTGKVCVKDRGEEQRRVGVKAIVV